MPMLWLLFAKIFTKIFFPKHACQILCKFGLQALQVAEMLIYTNQVTVTYIFRMAVITVENKFWSFSQESLDRFSSNLVSRYVQRGFTNFVKTRSLGHILLILQAGPKLKSFVPMHCSYKCCIKLFSQGMGNLTTKGCPPV